MADPFPLSVAWLPFPLAAAGPPLPASSGGAAFGRKIPPSGAAAAAAGWSSESVQFAASLNLKCTNRDDVKF